jgi:hypothetical protein
MWLRAANRVECWKVDAFVEHVHREHDVQPAASTWDPNARRHRSEQLYRGHDPRDPGFAPAPAGAQPTPGLGSLERCHEEDEEGEEGESTRTTDRSQFRDPLTDCRLNRVSLVEVFPGSV